MKINWLRLEHRIKAELRAINDLPQHTRYGDNAALCERLAEAVTRIDEIMASETRRGAQLDLGAVLDTATHEALQKREWTRVAIGKLDDDMARSQETP